MSPVQTEHTTRVEAAEGTTRAPRCGVQIPGLPKSGASSPASDHCSSCLWPFAWAPGRGPLLLGAERLSFTVRMTARVSRLLAARSKSMRAISFPSARWHSLAQYLFSFLSFFFSLRTVVHCCHRYAYS